MEMEIGLAMLSMLTDDLICLCFCRMGSGDIGLPMPPHIKLPMPPPIKSEHRTSLQQPEDPRRAVSPRRYGDDSHEHHRGRRKRGPSLLSREARPGSEIPLAVPHMENGGQREILTPTVYPPKIRPPAPANFHMPVPIRGKPNTRGRGRASSESPVSSNVFCPSFLSSLFWYFSLTLSQDSPNVFRVNWGMAYKHSW